MDFISSIINGCLVTAIVSVLALLAKKIWLSEFHIEVARKFSSNAKDADKASEKIFHKTSKDINKQMANSKSVKILAMRSSGLALDERCCYPNLWIDKNRTIEIVLSSLSNAAAIKERAAAINVTDEVYAQGIRHSFEALKLKKDYNNFGVYEHNSDLSFKLVILENYVYVFYYNEHISIHKSTVIRYSKKNITHEAFERYYDNIKKSPNTKKVEM